MHSLLTLPIFLKYNISRGACYIASLDIVSLEVFVIKNWHIVQHGDKKIIISGEAKGYCNNSIHGL